MLFILFIHPISVNKKGPAAEAVGPYLWIIDILMLQNHRLLISEMPH